MVRTTTAEYQGRFLITCSGLMADRVVRMLGIKPNFIICPFRGEYYLLPKEQNQIVNHLIYPIPNPAMPFLGVHLTRMIDGTVTVGPNAVLAMKREGYRKTDFSLSDMFETLTTPGILKVLIKNLRPGLIEMKNSLFKGGYLKEVQKYCPSIEKSDLTAYPAGVRAQAVSLDGKLIDDFLFVNTARSVSVCNAPSPAATSAIPIGAYIVEKVREQLASTGISFVKPADASRTPIPRLPSQPANEEFRVQLDDIKLFRQQAYINGAWADADSGEKLKVNNPATGEIIGSVPKMGATETRRAIEAADKALPAWRALTAKGRANKLRKWFDLMMANQEDLARLMTLEQGKPLTESRGEIAYAASFLEWFGEEAKRVYGDMIPGHQADKRLMVLKQPIGVTGAITPWNFPSAMITRKAGPALAAGCTMVLKPASQTPYSALALAELAERAGIPKGCSTWSPAVPVRSAAS